MSALNVLCAQITRALFAIAKFLFLNLQISTNFKSCNVFQIFIHLFFFKFYISKTTAAACHVESQ